MCFPDSSFASQVEQQFVRACEALQANPLALVGGPMLASLVSLQIKRSALWRLPPTTFTRLDIKPTTVHKEVPVSQLFFDQKYGISGRRASSAERLREFISVYTHLDGVVPNDGKGATSAKHTSSTGAFPISEDDAIFDNIVFRQESLESEERLVVADGEDGAGKTKEEVEADALQQRQKDRTDIVDAAAAAAAQIGLVR